jgi:hypothetical protein
MESIEKINELIKLGDVIAKEYEDRVFGRKGLNFFKKCSAAQLICLKSIDTSFLQ